MQYPCIVYSLNGNNSIFADNRPYTRAKRYQVTVIDQNPDSALPDLVEEIMYCSFERSFPAANLNHFVFNLFF